MNSSGINPTEYNVLVKPKIVEEKTSGGLFLPHEKKEKDQFAQTEGDLVAVSPLAFTYADNWPEGTMPSVGHRVVFSRYSATEIVGDDGEAYWIMKDSAIVGTKA